MNSGERFTPRILVAEDSAMCRARLAATLSDEPYEVFYASNGIEAWDLFRADPADIVITDWVMPGMTGIELCRRIRESQAANTYIILVTQNADKTNLIEALDAGADDYLTKPFDTGELLARIRVGCRTVEMSRRIEAQNAQLEQAARTDHLTGLPNRMCVEEFASKQLRAAIRHKFNLWIVVSDLDKFKLVNDTHGHFAGDEAIKRFATILKANSRASDICGRLGGDEFVMIMTHGERRSIIQTVDRLRADFANEKCRYEGHEIKVTASFGIAGFEGQGEPTLQELYTRADQALYAAKASGRNQVSLEIPKLKKC
jgi:two-component system, cell cycle response regulator